MVRANPDPSPTYCCRPALIRPPPTPNSSHQVCVLLISTTRGKGRPQEGVKRGPVMGYGGASQPPIHALAHSRHASSSRQVRSTFSARRHQHFPSFNIKQPLISPSAVDDVQGRCLKLTWGPCTIDSEEWSEIVLTTTTTWQFGRWEGRVWRAVNTIPTSSCLSDQGLTLHLQRAPCAAVTSRQDCRKNPITAAEQGPPHTSPSAVFKRTSRVEPTGLSVVHLTSSVAARRVRTREIPCLVLVTRG
ncbi:hypothetical protein B0T21DRAFT_129825 [Apiosordaria backusii]|uniref:Uncharacterized protein n=1 Tax=Apiosordaria backusii TaxID=314023 RepID=A0AA40K1N5_9PEZI|nr:hypothetical protein B0T21DRAFT_129825 [Apiosordaria backusii]